MKLGSIFAVIAIFVCLVAFQTFEAQATPIHLSASKLVDSKATLPMWSAMHQATWDFWSSLRQYLHQNLHRIYETRSVPVPSTILPFGIGFAGFVVWRSIRAHGRKQRKG